MDFENEEGKIRSPILDTPWIHKQVESHLIFGILAKYIQLRYVFIPILLIAIVFMMLDNFFQGLIIIASFLFAFITSKKDDRFTRLAVGWLVTKSILALSSFLLIIVAFPSSLKEGQSDAIPNLLLGLLWFPFLDFFPKITTNQKYLTICRIILTIPIVIIGIKSGQWYWQ